MHTNEQLLHRFYGAFQQGDYATMQRCYHDEAVFHDPVFHHLSAKEVRAMWQMLLEGARDLRIEYDQVAADNTVGSARWVARYTFSRSGRPVVNQISSSFQFKDGFIMAHRDVFDFWRWSAQALGISGKLLGWSTLLRNKVSAQARQRLRQFIGKSSA